MLSYLIFEMEAKVIFCEHNVLLSLPILILLFILYFINCTVFGSIETI